MRGALSLVLIAGLVFAGASSGVPVETGAVVKGAVEQEVLDRGFESGDGPVTLDLRFPAGALQGPDLPLAVLEEEQGIGPGTQLRIEFPDGRVAGCSANFIWSDLDENLYLGTAGHCLMPDLSMNGTHGPGADYDASGVVVRAAVEGCKLAASTFMGGVSGCVEKELEWAPLGDVFFAVYDDVGKDFGLVAIPTELHGSLRYEMPHWGGPYGESDLEEGDAVLQYGQGQGWKATPETRARVGYGLGPPGFGGYQAFGFSSAGDSGSATLLAREGTSAPDWEGGAALGIHTHGLAAGGLILGTLVSQAKWYVHCYADLAVWVEPGGVPHEEAPQDCPPECPEACDLQGFPVTTEITVDCVELLCSFDASGTHGSVVSYAWDFGDGSQADTYEPVVGHTYSEPGVYTVRLKVIDDEGLPGGTARVVNLFEHGALYLTGTFDSIPPFPNGNMHYQLSDNAPGSNESGRAYLARSTPAATLSNFFHYDVRGPIQLNGDVDLVLYFSCEAFSPGISPIRTISSNLEVNGETVASSTDATLWNCVEGSVVTRVEMAFQDVQTQLHFGDLLTISVNFWSTNLSDADLHLLVNSSEHPSRLEGTGLPGPVWAGGPES